MPANLTPQYQRLEEQYRRAHTAQERADLLEEMLATIPKHKGTEKLQADLKTKLKETKAELQAEAAAPKKVGKSFRFPRQGAGQVVIVGAPNAGKSRILKELTKAEPEVAPYPFTSREPMPGMMPWQDVSVQLIDTPPITDAHFEPYLLNLVRAADAVVLAFDGSSDDAPDQTTEVLTQFASRKTLLADSTGFDEEDFSIIRVKTLLVATRGDDSACEDRLAFFREMTETKFPTLKVDLDQPTGREALRDHIYQLLGVIRIYTKKPGKPADYSSPFVIKSGGTVEDLAAVVHRDLVETLKFAKVWGSSAHDGQSVGREHVLLDKDLVELHA
jgi:ribosome-interacting GTPase 1